MKTKAASHRKEPSSRRQMKRRPTRRAHGARRAAARPVIEEVKPAAVEIPSAEFEPDKREDELSDEEAVDREERHALY